MLTTAGQWMLVFVTAAAILRAITLTRTSTKILKWIEITILVLRVLNILWLIFWWRIPAPERDPNDHTITFFIIGSLVLNVVSLALSITICCFRTRGTALMNVMRTDFAVSLLLMMWYMGILCSGRADPPASAAAAV